MGYLFGLYTVYIDQKCSNLGLTIVITEQNVNFAMSLAEEIHLLETGRVRMTGTADELRNEQYIKETYFGI